MATWSSCSLTKASRPTIARLSNGDVSATTSRGEAVAQLFVAVVAGNSPLSEQGGEAPCILSRKLSGLAKRQEAVLVQGDGELLQEPILEAILRQADGLGARGQVLDASFAKRHIVNMASLTISTRLDPEEVKLLESLAELSGFDRSTLIKSLLRRGMKELRLDHAAQALRKEKATLSRAAELAGLDVWDFIAGMEGMGLELHYGVDELNQDLAALTTRS